MKTTKWFIISLLALALTTALAGCGRNKDKPEEVETLVDYQRTAPARNTGLAVPPDLTGVAPEVETGDRDTVGEAVQVTPVAGADTSSASAGGDSAAAVVAAPALKNVRIMRDGQVRWLEVDGEPTTVWPLVRDFWVTRNVALTIDAPLIGIIETDWIENSARYRSPLERFTKGFIGRILGPEFLDKYRFRVEAGTRPGTTEVYVTHRGLQLVAVEGDQNVSRNDRIAETRQQPTPPNVEYEIEIMRLLATHLGGDEERVTALIANLSGQGDDFVTRHSDSDGVPYLLLQDKYDGAWKRIGLALDRAGLKVLESDEKRGVYRFELATHRFGKEVQKKRGFFKKLFTREPKAEDNVTLTLEARLLVSDDGTWLRLYEEDGATLLDKTIANLNVRDIYDLLRDNLL